MKLSKKIKQFLALTLCTISIASTSTLGFANENANEIVVPKSSDGTVLVPELADDEAMPEITKEQYYQDLKEIEDMVANQDPSQRQAKSSAMKQYFNYHSIIWRGEINMYALRFNPKGPVRGNAPEARKAWKAAVAHYSYSSHLDSARERQSGYDQFLCHHYFAKSKTYWNIETARPVVSWDQIVKKKCNP